MGVTAAVLGSLLAAGKVDGQVFMAGVIGAGPVFGLLSFGIVEIVRLVEALKALRALVDAHIYYESLLWDARTERDKAKERVAEITFEKTALQATLSLLAGRNRAESEDKDAQR
jgi:hypothetical protein